MRVLLFVAVFVSVLLSYGVAQEGTLGHFQLFDLCGPMALVVDDLSDGAAAIDLTHDRIQTMAESRLRAARLHDADASSYLLIDVGVLVGDRSTYGAWEAVVAYHRWLPNPVAGMSGPAATWTVSSFGTHGGSAEFILQALSEHLDHFILEYLRVNEDACGQ